MENKEKIKSSVDYKILIILGNSYYKIGTIVIKTHKGDIFYTPSNNYTESPITLEKKEFEHISWHITGQTHIKRKRDVGKYEIIQKESERQKISEIGFQEMIVDTIKDFKLLPVYQKKVIPLDVVFNVGDYREQVCFKFSIVSGRLMVAQHYGQKVSIKRVNINDTNDGIAVLQRALGWHSGNSDMMLQYSLKKSNEKIRTNRKIFIPHDMKITKKNIKL